MSWNTKITNRAEYLAELKNHLARLPADECEDILRDQEEFFREAVLSGRTELDVIGSLGEPKQLAKTLIAESRVAASENALGVQDAKPASLPKQVNAMLRAFIAIIALAPFNLIFVLGPFIALLVCLFTAWCLGGVSLLFGLGSIVMVASELTGLGASVWAHVSSVFLGLSVTMFSLAFLGMLAVVTSWIAQGTVRYLRWNLDLIAERK